MAAYYWTSAQLRDAIDLCEREVEKAIKEHMDPVRIYGMRESLGTLRYELREAERRERMESMPDELEVLSD